MAMQGFCSTVTSVRSPRLRAIATGIALLAVTLGLPVRAFGLTLPASCNSFTDNPLAADSTPIKAVHITQLRTCIADLRTASGLVAVAWTDPTITAGVTVVKAVHVTEMRTALAAVFTAAGVTPPTYSHTPAAGGTIFAADLNEMRSAIPLLAGTPTCASPPSGLTPSGASWESSGGQGTTTLGYPAGCSYAVTSNAPWLTIMSAATTTVTYQVTMNDSLAARSGTLTIAGLTFTVTQAAAAEVVTYIDTDAVGSVRMTTNAAGQVMARYDYLPFGTLWTAPSTNEKRLFGGKERDQETSFDYFGARYYASGLGRFTAPDDPLNDQDPLDPQSWGLYTYARNNPFQFMDPTGRSCVHTTGANAETITTDDADGKGCSELQSTTTVVRGLAPTPPLFSAVALGAQRAQGPVNLIVAGGALMTASVASAGITTTALASLSPAEVAGGTGLLLNTARGNLLQGARNPDLRNLIEQMYRLGATIGSGSTADAIRHELMTGELLSRAGHSIKGAETIMALNKLVARGALDPGDIQIARQLIEDLKDALRMK